MSDSDFVLGAPVEFSHIIVRETGWIEGKGKTKTWFEYKCKDSGFIVGWRTLSNGYVERVVESDGYYGSVHVDNAWIASKYFKAYIVTTDLRLKPSWVLPNRLELKGGK